MQKNYLFIAILCLIANATLFAQVDVKIGPFGPIFGTLNLRSGIKSNLMKAVISKTPPSALA
jgi:hypothetical protein